MIIKKQLSHTRVDFLRMGILGSVALVHVLANPELIGDLSVDGELNQSTASSLTITDSSRSGVLTSEQRLTQAKTIINLVRASTKRVPDVDALFMVYFIQYFRIQKIKYSCFCYIQDEMASTSLIHDIHPSLHSHLYETTSESFQVQFMFCYLFLFRLVLSDLKYLFTLQEHFVVDESDQKIDIFPIPLSLQYGLDTVEEDTPSVTLIFLNIAPMIIKESNRKAGEKTSQPTITTLMSHFRLLRNTIDSFDQVTF